MSEHEQAEPETRWSARKKADVVMRLLRGESLEEVSRDVKVEVHRLAAWRDDFIAKRGDRFACLEPVYDAVRDHFGAVDRNVARQGRLLERWSVPVERASQR